MLYWETLGIKLRVLLIASLNLWVPLQDVTYIAMNTQHDSGLCGFNIGLNALLAYS